MKPIVNNGKDDVGNWDYNDEDDNKEDGDDWWKHFADHVARCWQDADLFRDPGENIWNIFRWKYMIYIQVKIYEIYPGESIRNIFRLNWECIWSFERNWKQKWCMYERVAKNAIVAERVEL